VTFLYDTKITGLTTDTDTISGVETSRGTLSADRYVVALGSYSPLLLARIGISLPIYPIKGYSLTVPITDANVAPVSTVMDETYKVATTRLGDRIRIGGTAEIAGYDNALHPSRRGPLDRSLRDLFPLAGDGRKATFWCGLRPMTPDGPPVLGRAERFNNLYLNTGHGTLGWTMAAGSGRALADLISERPAEIDTSDLGLARYRS
jgi:D-amino-acid dehydrogenase